MPEGVETNTKSANYNNWNDVLKDFWPDLYRIYRLSFAERVMGKNLGQLLKSGLLKNTTDALKAGGDFLYLLLFADNLSEDKVASSKPELKVSGCLSAQNNSEARSGRRTVANFLIRLYRLRSHFFVSSFCVQRKTN